MTRDDFQREHGQVMAQILNLPAFNAAVVLLSIEVTDGICNLTDEQIEKQAALILADYRGRLRNQKNLMTLPILVEPPTPQTLTEEYPDAAEEAWQQHQKNQ